MCAQMTAHTCGEGERKSDEPKCEWFTRMKSSMTFHVSSNKMQFLRLCNGLLASGCPWAIKMHTIVVVVAFVFAFKFFSMSRKSAFCVCMHSVRPFVWPTMNILWRESHVMVWQNDETVWHLCCVRHHLNVAVGVAVAVTIACTAHRI